MFGVVAVVQHNLSQSQGIYLLNQTWLVSRNDVCVEVEKGCVCVCVWSSSAGEEGEKEGCHVLTVLLTSYFLTT